jgi:hypothetical protein
MRMCCGNTPDLPLASAERRLRLAARGGSRVDAEQVRHRAREVAFVAVDGQVLEEVGVVPRREFFLAQVGYGFAELRANLSLAESEIEADAAHALTLELQRIARIGIDGFHRQRLRDRGVGFGETAGVDQRRDAGKPAVGRTCDHGRCQCDGAQPHP